MNCPKNKLDEILEILQNQNAPKEAIEKVKKILKEKQPDKVVEEITELKANAAKGIGKHSANAKTHNAELKKAQKHDIQDAKKDYQWSFMKPIDVKYSNIPDPSSIVPKIGYTLSEDYPNSIGKIDEVGNFEKLNITKKYKAIGFRGGYTNFIDAENNYYSKFPATKFDYVFGDTYFFSGGNGDEVYLGNYYTKIYKDLELEVLKNQIEKIVGNITRKVLKNVEEKINKNRTIKIGGNDELKIGGNLKINAGGKIDIIAGGVITINGAIINLN